MIDKFERALRIPRVDDHALDRYNRAHSDTFEALAALSEPIQQVTTRWLRERAVEALAGVRASSFGRDGPLLFPVPRGFLGPLSSERITGTRRALDHIDLRLQAVASGELQDAVSWETPFVIHALTAAGTSKQGDRVSLLRAGRSGWRDREHPYQPPGPREVPELLEATFQRLAGSSEPAAVSAAWFAFTWMTLHPFEDGNGRTARLLHQLISATGLPCAADWGIAEMWVVHRSDYHDRLKAGQGLSPTYDPKLIDARPFVEASLQWSTDGAELTTARVTLTAELTDDLPGSDRLQAAILAVLLSRGLQPGRLLPWSSAEQVDCLERAVATGTIARTRLPASRRMAGDTSLPYYVPTELAWRQLQRLLDRRHSHSGQR